MVGPLEAGQIGPKPNRPKVKSAPSQIGPIFVVYYCQHAKLNSLNTIQQNIFDLGPIWLEIGPLQYHILSILEYLTLQKSYSL